MRQAFLAVRLVAREIDWAVVVAAVLVLVIVVAAMVAVSAGEARDRRADTVVTPWEATGPPVGQSQVFSRCQGYTRLYLTVGPGGAPVGPVQVQPYENGSRCDP